MSRSVLRPRDLSAEACAGLLQRPGRSVLTMIGTVLGVGAFVVVSGLAATAGGQVDQRFTALSATEVVVKDAGNGDDGDARMSFSGDASDRVQALNGVVHAGVWWPIPLATPVISSRPDSGSSASGLGFVGADASYLEALRPTLASGRLFDRFHSGRKEQVAVLGSTAARRLGVSHLGANPAILVDGTPYTVIGILSDVDRHPEVLVSLVVPASTALELYGEPREVRAEMLIEVEIGAAGLIASQAALALRPDAPERFEVVPPPDPKRLRNDVAGDLKSLFLLLAAISVVVGASGIANTTLISVLERVEEIGLRRAVGAQPGHIAAQFLAESTVLGLLGGLIGAATGTTVVVGVSVTQQWTPLLEPWNVLMAPLIGGASGLLAGAYPAARAARVEPVEALRR